MGGFLSYTRRLEDVDETHGRLILTASLPLVPSHRVKYWLVQEHNGGIGDSFAVLFAVIMEAMPFALEA
jgi:hypothetical protein